MPLSHPPLPAPTFEEWVEYCFTLGYRDYRVRDGASDVDAAQDRCDLFLNLDSPRLAKYLTRLFKNPAHIAERYSDDQIGAGVWFLFGTASDYFFTLRDGSAPLGAQLACVSSIAHLYTTLFDRVCCRRGADPDGNYIDTLDVDVAVYMIWDMGGGVDSPLWSQESHPQWTETVFGVLEEALRNCRTSSCHVSVLHGLGHLRESNQANRQCAEQIIDHFLASSEPPEWVRQYALSARMGHAL